MKSLQAIDLDSVTGGVDLSTCRTLSKAAGKFRRAGWGGVGDQLSDLSNECRAEFRAGHPGVINAVKSWF